MPISTQTMTLIAVSDATTQQAADIIKSIEVDMQAAKNKKSRKPFSYTDAFNAFWKAFPTHPNMSKLEAFKEWEKLSTSSQHEAFKAIAPFKAYCAKHPDYQIIHACRFLKYERFEGFMEETRANEAAAAEFAKLVFVEIDTPEWFAWKKVQPINSTIWSEIHHANGWHFPTAFPPGSP